MDKDAIKQLVADLKIPFLVHFTRLPNLPTIISHGLCPIGRAAEIGLTPHVNDYGRFDGHRGATSLSIAHPNDRMFYKCRQDNQGVEWVVLGISPSILWTKDCAFSRYNAADSRISSQPVSTLKTADSLAGMFAELDGLPARSEHKLKSHDPTDVQAEVLVFDVIEPKYIRGVVFQTSAARDAHKGMLGDRQQLVQNDGKGYFAARRYVRWS